MKNLSPKKAFNGTVDAAIVSVAGTLGTGIAGPIGGGIAFLASSGFVKDPAIKSFGKAMGFMLLAGAGLSLIFGVGASNPTATSGDSSAISAAVM